MLLLYGIETGFVQFAGQARVAFGNFQVRAGQRQFQVAKHALQIRPVTRQPANELLTEFFHGVDKARAEAVPARQQVAALRPAESNQRARELDGSSLAHAAAPGGGRHARQQVRRRGKFEVVGHTAGAPGELAMGPGARFGQAFQQFLRSRGNFRCTAAGLGQQQFPGGKFKRPQDDTSHAIAQTGAFAGLSVAKRLLQLLEGDVRQQAAPAAALVGAASSLQQYCGGAGLGYRVHSRLLQAADRPLLGRQIKDQP